MSETKPTNPKDAIGCDKVPMGLWPPAATALGCMALLDGMLKYGRANWRDAGVRASIYVDALLRHVYRWQDGEECDPDSGLPHLAHALACLAILSDAQACGKLTDDRPIAGGLAEQLTGLTPHVARLREKHKNRTVKHFTRDALAPAPHTNVFQRLSEEWGDENAQHACRAIPPRAGITPAQWFNEAQAYLRALQQDGTLPQEWLR